MKILALSLLFFAGLATAEDASKAPKPAPKAPVTLAPTAPADPPTSAAPAPAVPEESVGSLAVGICWFGVIGVMFFAQHHVCDSYFIPAIEVFVDTFKAKGGCYARWAEQSVAGATICALGCNGPELFSNLISLFTGSDAGIGVVVGSEIFNILIIIGCSTVAAKTLPLEIESFSFTRDCAFYALSIVLLYLFLGPDSAVQLHEALILFGCLILYVSTVYFSDKIEDCFVRLRGGGKSGQLLADAEAVNVIDNPQAKKSKIRGVEVTVEEHLHGRMADCHNEGNVQTFTMDPTEIGMIVESKEEDQSKFRASSNRAPMKRASVGFDFGGQSEDGSVSTFQYQDMTEIAFVEDEECPVILIEFLKHGVGHITLKVTTKDIGDQKELIKRLEQNMSGELKKQVWIHKYEPGPGAALEHLKHAFHAPGIGMKLFALVEFPIDFILRATLSTVDVKAKGKKKYYPACFCGAMFWLAVFSFLMLEVATAINYNIPALPMGFLGFTVCAIGTSFPNAVASIIMSSKGMSSAAIANALGSNVQNVFLAMAVPWLIYFAVHPELIGTTGIVQSASGLVEGVVFMAFTEVMVIILVCAPLGGVCKLTKFYGMLLVASYFVWLAFTCGETFNCWPRLIPDAA